MPDSLIKGTDVSVYQSYPTVGLSGTFYVKPAILAITRSFEEPERHLLGSEPHEYGTVQTSKARSWLVVSNPSETVFDSR